MEGHKQKEGTGCGGWFRADTRWFFCLQQAAVAVVSSLLSLFVGVLVIDLLFCRLGLDVF